MTAKRKDPLLTITLVVTRVASIVLIVAVVATIVAMGLIAFDATQGSEALISENPGIDPAALRRGLWMLLPLAALGMLLAAGFMHLLSRIVASVADRNPFDAINARRLYMMGWLAVGFQLVAIPVRIAEGHLNRLIEGSSGDFAIGVGGFVLALTLFVLARVFERGAAMQDDLEGTV